MPALPALLRFHALGAARVAQRNALLAIGVTIFLVGSAPGSTSQLVRHVTQSIAARGTPPGAAIAVTLLAGALAAGAVRTVATGLGGWIRSAPLSAAHHRRALTLALLLPMLPLLALIPVAMLAAWWGYGSALDPAKLVGLPLALLAAAATAVRSRGELVARPLAAAAALLAAQGRWAWICAAVVMLVTADLVAGPLRPTTLHAGPSRLALRSLSTRLTLRAIGWRGASAFALPAVLIGFAHLYRVNNELSIRDAASALRGCALAGVTLLLVALADLMLVRRPVWPWARSLPVSARRRVLDDAALLGGAALLLLAMVAGEDWRTALVVLAAIPLLALHTSGAVRRGHGRMSRAGGEVLVLGAAVVVVVTLWPATSLACLAAAPIALLAAEHADRRTRATAWSELHHSVGGDSLAGSAH